MSEQGSGERVWDIIENVGVCMLTTQAVRLQNTFRANWTRAPRAEEQARSS